MADTENKLWVHLLMEKDLAKLMDRMVADDDSDRSKFIRNLIRQEATRRGHLPTPKKNKADDRLMAVVQ